MGHLLVSSKMPPIWCFAAILSSGPSYLRPETPVESEERVACSHFDALQPEQVMDDYVLEASVFARYQLQDENFAIFVKCRDLVSIVFGLHLG